MDDSPRRTTGRLSEKSRQCGHRILASALLVLLPLVSACQYLRPPVETYTGPTLPPSPSLEQVANFVNTNARQIQSFTADQASISGPGFPSLRSQIVFERPRRLRILGETSLTGLELDVGSNDELFWFWVRRNEPPATYFCRYDRYYTSAARQLVPIDPEYLIDALGLVEIDPAKVISGPVPVAGNRLEIRSRIDSPEGPLTQVLLVDAKYGLVTAQHLYDESGRLIASATNLNHRRDPVTGLTLPRRVKIEIPRSELSLLINLGNAKINRVVGDRTHLWTMPNYAGYPLVDLSDPRIQAIPAAATRSEERRPAFTLR
ncbi:hypothetical protein [Thermostilla marina]